MAHKVWNKLEHTYDTKHAVNKILIPKILATCKKNYVVYMRNHTDKINILISDLKLSWAEENGTVKFVYISMRLLRGFVNVMAAFENQQNTVLTSDFV